MMTYWSSGRPLRYPALYELFARALPRKEGAEQVRPALDQDQIARADAPHHTQDRPGPSARGDPLLILSLQKSASSTMR